ncbi:MAG TPA: ANTAR domain-containing protein [Mycobacteriales bacterium]|nr:ANTAR domain-containing protein [Mycobacteriales bacterium]
MTISPDQSPRPAAEDLTSQDRRALVRDHAADERDRAADERDRLADLRDLLAQERIRVAEDGLAGMIAAMDSRAIIEQAKGMIMITLKVDADAAFDVLVRRSQVSHLKLADVAAEIVHNGTRPQP